MPLLLVDLDDTLVDRNATFDRWTDAHPRFRFLHRLPDRWQLHRLVSRLAALYERSELSSYRLEDGVVDALQSVRRAGWLVAVTTNGNRRTQPAKIASAGLEPLVDVVVISSHEGFAKPDPRLFQLAAERAGCSLDGAWAIGDDLTQEIAGAARLGLRSIWVNPHRRPASPDVDLEATSFPEAVDLLLSVTAR